MIPSSAHGKPKDLGSKGRQTALEKHFTTVLVLPVYVMVANLPFAIHCSIQKHGVGGTCSYVVRAVARWLLLQALALLAIEGQEKAVATTRQVMCAVDRSVVVQ